MNPKGMVHALEKIHSLLGSQGVLVNVQPIGEPRPIEIRDGEERLAAGAVQHRLNFTLHKRAQAAVDEVLRRGLFRLEQAFTFPFLYYAPSFDELARWLREDNTNAILPNEVAARGQGLWRRAGPDRSVYMGDDILVMRLLPNSA